MTTPEFELDDSWVNEIQLILKPHLHQVLFGNLRYEFASWIEERGLVANMAVVYEVPGGSTNQINIVYEQATKMFSFIDLDTHEERVTKSLPEVLNYINDMVQRIPDTRKHRLVEDIDRWAAEGLSQKDLFQKMTKLLQIEDLKGGTITLAEMKIGIAHILSLSKMKV